MSLSLADVQKGLDSILEFISPQLKVASVHCSEFITKDHWSLLSPCIKKELLVLSDRQLQQLPLLVHGHISDGKPLDLIFSFTDSCGLSQTGNNEETENVQSDSKKKREEGRKHLHDYSPSSDVDPNLKEFCTRAQKCSVDGLKLHIGVSDLFKYLGCKQEDGFIGTFMNVKKCHEIEQMSSLCSALYHHASCDLVVDFGSGKGYLGNQLVLQHGISVLGLDSESGNTQSASRRNRILDKQWKGLERNSVYAAENKKLTKKEKKRLKMHKLYETPITDSTKAVRPSNVTAVDIKNTNAGVLKEDSEMLNVHSGPVDKRKAHYVPFTQFIDKNTDFLHLAQNCFPDVFQTKNSTYLNKYSRQYCNNLDHDLKKLNIVDASCYSKSCKTKECNPPKLENDSDAFQNVSMCCERQRSMLDKNLLQCQCTQTSAECSNVKEQAILQDNQCACAHHCCCDVDTSYEQPKDSIGRLCLTGLHTCGDLANTSLEAFITSPSIQVICNVGCCYHLMMQKYAQGKMTSDSTVGFPMSQYLMNKGLYLGTAALNLASQSIHRVAETQQLQGERFFPRAVLEVLVADICVAENVTWTGLRKLEQKCTDNRDYIAKGCEKLGISEKVTDEMITTYLNKYSEYQHKLGAFFQLKAILAPCIEAVVMLDRVCFLLEQERVKDVFLVKMFDPLKSPRCYGIVGLK